MVGARFSSPGQTSPAAHPASCTMGTGSFPGVKSSRCVTLTPHPLLVPWSRKGRAIPLLPLWAVRPVQSLSACTRGHFVFFLVQPALVIADLQGCPAESIVTEVHNIRGPVQLCFKIRLKLVPFGVHICSILLHVNKSKYILHIQQHVLHIYFSAVVFFFLNSIKFNCFVKLDK